ncbi:MAG: tyrosine-type recombinase/integrase [Bdellovibrionales bacterium]
MTKKIDPKVFKGALVWAPVAGHKGIRRRWAWNEAKLRYEDPPGGPQYQARRVSELASGREARCFSSLQGAREWKERRNVQVETQNTTATCEHAGYTVADLVRDFKAKRYPFLAEGTVILYERRLELLEPLFTMNVDDLTSQNISDWIDWLKSPEMLSERRNTRVSFEKELKALSTLLRWHIEENDDSRLVFPIKRKHFAKAEVRKRAARQVVLSDDELTKWLTALKQADPLFYAMAVVQVYQVLRVSEVCAMRWSNLDLPNGRYHIREHVLWPRVGGKPPSLAVGTKTTMDSYWVPLWTEVQAVLSTLDVREGCDLIFHDQGNLLTYRQIQYAYDIAFSRAGLPHRGTHVCRHTGATRFLDQTQDLLGLQQLGGWKDQGMPQHYAKIRSQRAEQAMRESEKRLRLVSSTRSDEQAG